MRGKVLGVDPKTGKGQISGEDGTRYQFDREDWSAKIPPAIGAEVDFEVDGKNALSVFRTDSAGLSKIRTAPKPEKNKIVAALLAFFLGGLGVHKFYLGYNGAGIAMALISIFGIILLAIPTAIIGLIAFVEFIIYLVTDDEDFQERYVENERPWF
jgi:TM2 domain-containing membrane protein YozV